MRWKKYQSFYGGPNIIVCRKNTVGIYRVRFQTEVENRPQLQLKYTIISKSLTTTRFDSCLPSDVLRNLSLFFFRFHFQGRKKRPILAANFDLRDGGGVAGAKLSEPREEEL